MQVVRLGVQLLYGPQVATAAEGVLGTYPLSQTTVHLSWYLFWPFWKQRAGFRVPRESLLAVKDEHVLPAMQNKQATI